MNPETLGLKFKLYKEIKVGQIFYFQTIKEENLSDISKLEIFKRVQEGPGWTSICIKTKHRTKINVLCLFNNESKVLVWDGIVITI